MSYVDIQPYCPWRIKPHRFCDNGMLVQADLQRRMVKALNHGLRFHPKQLFSYLSQFQTVIAAGGAGQRDRWHHAFHTGTHTDEIGVLFYMAPQRAGASDPYSQFKIDGGSSLTYHFGNSTGAPADAPSNTGISLQFLDVSADTDYTATWSDFDNGRLIGGLVFEVTYEPDTANGYLSQGAAVLGPIMDTDRETPIVAATNMWKRNAAHLFNWCVDSDSGARTRTSTTDINLIDNSSTAVSSSTPGPVIDLRYLASARYAQAGVTPKVSTKFMAYGKCAGGGTGHVYLKNSAGTVIGTININSTTLGWFSASISLDNTGATGAEKLDIHYDSDGVNLTTVHAVCLYQYLA